MPKKPKPDTAWIHREVGLAVIFNAQDNGRNLAVDFTTILGVLPRAEGEQPTYLVLVEATETESRGEYSWPIEEYWTVTRGADGTPVVDEATPEQVRHLQGGN